MNPYLRLRFDVAPRGHSGPGKRSHGAPLLRRVLTEALVGAFCAIRRPVCDRGPAGEGVGRASCTLVDRCPYGVLFAGARTARPPLALHVPAGKPGAPLASVELSLLGPAWSLYPWLSGALVDGLREGIGRRRQSYELRGIHRVDADGRTERLAGGKLAALPLDLEPDGLEARLDPPGDDRHVTIELLSPTRLVHDGALVGGNARLPFRALVGRIVERLTDIYGADAGAALDPGEREGLDAAADAVQLVEDRSRWVEQDDYSARNKGAKKLGGKMGRLVYGPGAARFLPLLRAGAAVQVGKNVLSGCGRFDVAGAAAPDAAAKG